MSTFKDDFDLIRQSLFELNNKLDIILAEQEQRKRHEEENSNLFQIKQSLENNLQFLNAKFCSLPSTGIDDRLAPVFCSTVDQLEAALEKLKSVITADHVIRVPELAQNAQMLNEKFNALVESNECSNHFVPNHGPNPNHSVMNLNPIQEMKTHADHPDVNLQLSINSQLLEEQLDRLKAIFYKRHQAKLEELFGKLKSKHDDALNKYKKRTNFRSELKEYSRHCVNSSVSKKESRREFHKRLRILSREKFQDDRKFKHYFHVFFREYNKDLFRLVLKESKAYIPRTQLLVDRWSQDIKCDLYTDIEQLRLIYRFVSNVYNSVTIERFYQLIQTKTPLLDLFYNQINHSISENDYLNSLKESYLVFVRDSILPLNREDERAVESNEQIQLVFNQMKRFNEESLKLIHDSEKNMKNTFIRQFRGNNWNEKLISDDMVLTDSQTTQIATEQDVQFRSTWANTANPDQYSESENHILEMEDSVEKSARLFEQSKMYKEKRPCLKLYLKKSIDLVNKSIASDESIINSNTNASGVILSKRLQLSKYEFRALIYLDMANKYDFPCFEKLNYFNKSKHDFIHYDALTTDEDNLKFNERNFVKLFKQAFLLNDRSSMNSYDRVLQINPYFFEAQYQKLLKFYELNDCAKMCHLHESFSTLPKSAKPIVDLFEILIDLASCDDRFKANKSASFFNKTLKIKVRNNQSKSLYLHFSKTQYSYQVKFNNEEQLINLLKYDKVNMVRVKKNSDKSSKLKYQLSNFDFKQLLGSLTDRITTQKANFLELVQLFRKLELVNENEYKKLDEKFLKLLPETRFNLIRCTSNSDHFQAICEISKSMKEFKNFLNDQIPSDNEISQRILQLKYYRAQIYRKKHCFYLEELEFLDILKNQKTSSDHNPMIYYRLSYLYKLRGDLQMSIHYINLASKKYDEKVNKKIFKKIEKLKSTLVPTATTKPDLLAFFDNNKMNLLQIFNLITKSNLEPKLSITHGFQLFEDSSPNALLNCLFYHLIEEHTDLEEYFNKNDNIFTRGYTDLQKNKLDEEETLIAAFNTTFNRNLKCLFIDENDDTYEFTYAKNEVPIIIFKDYYSNTYKTTKQVNHLMFLTALITTYNAKDDLKSICSKFLNDEISKNILRNTNENTTIELFIQSMVACENMKIFSEEVVYFLTSDEYDPCSFNFWSLVADLDMNETLNSFKELFTESIEEYRQEKEDEHKSALELINYLIEQNVNKQKYLSTLNKLKEEIIKSLSIYDNVRPKSQRRKRLVQIMSSNDEIDEKFKQLISSDCFDINLQFGDTNEEELFFQFLKNNDEHDIPFILLSLIEDSFSEPEMHTDDAVITVQSYNIFLSDIIEDLENKLEQSTIEEVRLYGTNIFMNTSLNNEYWHGINLTTGSDIIDFVKDESGKKITINLAGLEGEDGEDAEDRRHATRESEDGLDGLPGGDGQAGENGGNIYLIANKQFKGKENIEKFMTSGGEGGKGGKGGNAGDGRDGKKGEDASEENSLGILVYGYHHKKGKPGTQGGNGGQGGDAGLGGAGGHAGVIYIEENQTITTDRFAKLIEANDKSNTSGKHGSPGAGGKGGTDGSDGNDILYHRRHGFTKKQVYRGHIKLTKIKENFFSCDVDFIREEKPQKRNGISHGKGKSADVQLHSGKVRNKSENKEKSNKQQIKNQLDQVIHNSHEQSNNISNNIANSINLLKDQLDEILDERESIIKTHQLSNSLIANAYQIAQQSLALNAIKMNSKIENTILRTSDSENNKRDKFLIQLKLSVDNENKQNIKFQTDNLSVNKLIKCYRRKIDDLKSQVDNDIITTKSKIRSLELEGKHIVFKIDVESLKNSYIISKNRNNEINLSSCNGIVSTTTTSELVLNQDLTLLIKNYESFLDNRNSQQYQPFVLNQYFHDLRQLKERKKSLMRTKKKIDELEKYPFISEICLEYGSKELINQKLPRFYRITDFNGSRGTNDFELFDMIAFIKQDDLLTHDSNDYQVYLTEIFQDKPDGVQFIKEISHILIESKVSMERIKKSETFLALLVDVLKEKKTSRKFELMQCTPIYHDPNEPLEVHLIEELINQFLELKDKNIELLARILQCFKKIIVKDKEEILCEDNAEILCKDNADILYEDNAEILCEDTVEVLCKNKVAKFTQFLIEYLINIRIDFDQGYLLNTMKHELNSIQMACSPSLFYKLFDRLELIILIREKQFSKLNNYINKIKMYFQNEQDDIDSEIEVINHLKKNRKPDIFYLFKDYVQSLDIDFQKNTNVQQFINNLHLVDPFKDKIRVILGDFHQYLIGIEEYNYSYVMEHPEVFSHYLNLFFKEQKMNIKSKLDDLSKNKEKCENTIHLLYQNMDLQTNITFLNHIDTSDNLDVNDFVQNVQELYEKLRLQKLGNMNQQKTDVPSHRIDFNEGDVNEKTGDIYLISRQINDTDEMQIKNGYRIIIVKENVNRFTIYFRDRQNFEIREHLLNEPKVIEMLNNRNFQEETLLSKEKENYIYKSIYQEVESKNGFTKYSIEQIKSFATLKEFVDDKLPFLKGELQCNIYQYIVDEIESIFDSESPDVWSCRVHFLFTNINILTKMQDKFKNEFTLSSAIEIKRLDCTDSTVFTIVTELIEKLSNGNQDDRLILFYQCLSMFDHLLIEITKRDLKTSIHIKFEEIARNLSEKFEPKDDVRNGILYEIILKNNQILKQCYSNEILKLYEEKKKEISNSIDSSSVNMTIKDKLKNELQLQFNDLINNGYLILFDYIDEIYLTSSKTLPISTEYNIYSKLIAMINEFFGNIKFNSNSELSDSALEKTLERLALFLDHVRKQCLIFISGLDTIDDPLNKKQISEILHELKTSNMTLEKCSLRVLPITMLNIEKQDSLHTWLNTVDQLKNVIITSKISAHEFQIIYRRLHDNKIESLSLKKEDDEDIFGSLEQLNEGDFIDDQRQLEEYERLYSLIKMANGSIYKNHILFDEKIFMEIFVHRVMKNHKEIPLKDYLNSFEIILKNSDIESKILISMDEALQNLIKTETNKELIEIFNQFGLLINEKYQYLLSNAETDFTNLLVNVKRKNRILNITFKALSNRCKENTIEPIGFGKNDLINTTLEIRKILQTHTLRLPDIVHCCEQLNKALVQTPCNCLRMFKNQLDRLKLKIRQFIENIDYAKDSPMTNDFDQFNAQLTQMKSISNQSILNLLKKVLQNSTSIEAEKHKSMMNKILLNFQMNNDQCSFEILAKIESEMTQFEKTDSIRKDYFMFIIKIMQSTLNSKYQESLKEYEQKTKGINDLVKEIIDLFWFNISSSDLLNKERERTYFTLNIDKLFRIANADSDQQKTITAALLTKIKELQFNSNKKQFTNAIHTYLNHQINGKLSQTTKIMLPIELDDDIENLTRDVLNNNYANADSIIILDELSILFESCIDGFENQSIYNQFFESFKNKFQYFCWRLVEYEPASKQGVIDKAIDRFTAAIKTFKMKVSDFEDEQPQLKYNHFYEFEKIFNLRTNENQLQEELNTFQGETREKLDTIERIIKAWLTTLDNCISNTNPSITSTGKHFLDQINGLFSLDATHLKYKEKHATENKNTGQSTQLNAVKEQQQESTNDVGLTLELKFAVLNKLSLQICNEEKEWAKKKILIGKFDQMKEKLFEIYLQSIRQDGLDPSMDLENSIVVKQLKEIITQTDVNEWSREMNDLSINLFTVNLLKLYDFDLDVLRNEFRSIENSLNQNHDDDDVSNTVWQNEVKDKESSMAIIDYIIQYSQEKAYTSEASLACVIKQFIEKMNTIKALKSSIDTLYFFVGYDNFIKLTRILQLKLINSNSIKLNVKKLTEIFYLLSNSDNFNTSLGLLDHFNVNHWLLYLNINKIESYFHVLFQRYFDEFNMNDYTIENYDNLDELIESKYHEMEINYDNSLKNISQGLKVIELNRTLNVDEREMLFDFVKSRLAFELKKDANYLVRLKDLEVIFNQYLTETTILEKVINSLKKESSNVDDNDDKYEEKNDQLTIENIRSKSFNSLLPYLTRFWIIERLGLDRKALDNERTKIIQYLELIKTSHSEEKMFQLVDCIQTACKTEKIISSTVIDLLMNIANNEWILNDDVLDILNKNKINEWEKQIEIYMKKKRCMKRDFNELINLMKEDKNSLNKSIKVYLNNGNILHDLQLLTNKLKSSVDSEISHRPVEEWTEDNIQNWAEKIKGNRLLSDKEQVQNAIVVVSRAIYLFTEKNSEGGKKGFYPRDTQILALWLFLNPDLNQTNTGCLAQISTGEGKSIIVAALAAIKALGCHRIDVITSSSVLAIRDAKEFQPFFTMFKLQVSNNCDAACEQGAESQSAEQIRKLRYYNQNGPVDIIYGECSCFERDILLTEFNKNDPSQNIIGQRLSQNSVSSVIVDEVDSMLLDKANMVLYLSHTIDTLKALERIFISIWQTINQQAFDSISGQMITDDLIELVSDMVLGQIDNKSIDIPEYDSHNCDYINIKLFIKRRMPVWIRSAFHVRDMIPNDTYIISRDKSDKSSKSEVKITVMDKDTGTEQLSTRWSNGVHQFLQLKHTRRLTPESLKAVYISNMSFFKRYKNHIVGLTGSLGSIDEQFLLNKVFQVRFFELPRFKQELFRELKGSVNTAQETWLESIKNALDREIKFKSVNKDKRRAALIICDNVKSVLILKEYLSGSYPNAKDYKSAYEDFEIDELHPGDIIIATNLAGRGTDLETSDKLEENGGLHVITTYLPTNIRIEMQAFGRTARKGNKGTGEYIIMSQYGLSIETMKQLRNSHEKERLDSFLIHDLPKIKIEEDLLQGFVDDNDDQLSCIGFTKLYQKIESQLLNDSRIMYNGDEYRQYQLYSLKNRWAFWLDSMTEYINMINVVGKKAIIDKFNEFQLTVEKDVEANNFPKLIIEPAELIKLGKYYRDKENWSKALLCYEQASHDKFYSFTNYYTSTCRQNIDYAKGIQSKRELKHSLIDVKLSIDKELQFLNNAAQLAFEIGEKTRKLGLANYGNEYDKQVREKLTIWSIFSGTITNSIGSSIDPKDLITHKHLYDEKKAEELLKRLQAKQFIKPSRITKKAIKQLELPSIFNNDLTKQPLMDYLNKKSEGRTGSGDLNELNAKIFKDDLKQMDIFLPYLNSFIDLIQRRGFIQQMKNDDTCQLFSFQTFDEEKLKETNFPRDIFHIKERLFDWAKEIAKEKGLVGTKEKILEYMNSYFISNKDANITHDQLKRFFEFLNEHSCLEKINQYSVNKEKLMQTINGEYKYSNFYDFERHYTEEFEKFDSIFRKNFLKIILLQQDSDMGDSYFILKDTINANDFELHKTIDDAIDYLWSYLKSIPLIKPPRVNIGLISSKEVNDKREEMKKEIEAFLKNELSNVEKKELGESVDAVFNIIDQTIGDLKKMPDDKTIASYLQIKTTFFLDNKKHVPEALEEFIDLALDVIFRLEEKKEPPQWYEIAAVVALGVVQVVAGVLAKAFIPVVGQLIGEFLISTGCDDILFGVQCALSGEFSWDKYWQHKKRSMITSAITAVFFVAVSYLKNAKRLKSFQKAWDYQKLTGVQNLRTAATALNASANIGKYIGKEIAKTLVQTGLAELASVGIDSMLNTISNTYESELRDNITKSVKDKWKTVESEMLEIFRLTEGKNSGKIIEDCITRKLQNLSEEATLKTFTRRCGPVMQGLGKALADVKGATGTILSVITSRAPTLIGLGVSIKEIIVMISSFMKNLADDLKDARKKLTNTNKQHVLTETQLTDCQNFQKDKIDQISNHLTESFNQKLKSGIIAPLLNYASNMLISRGIESIAGADRIERLANTFELIHAASNPTDTRTQYADDLTIFLAEARPVDINDLTRDPKDIYPANMAGQNLKQVYDQYGGAVKTFIGRNGKLYVRRPSMKDYYRSVKGDKPAGLHEQRKVDEVLGCVTTKGEIVNNEQQCTLRQRGGSKVVEFVIKDNLDGTKHAEIIVDGKSRNIDSHSQNKNDCYYNTALVANEMSKGKTFDQAMKILDDKNAVNDLRNDVSSAMKNDEKLLDEFRWTNRTDLNAHSSSLTGLYLEKNVENVIEIKLDDDDVTRFKTSFAYAKRPPKFGDQEVQQAPDGTIPEAAAHYHHLIPAHQIKSEIDGYIQGSTNDEELKRTLEMYLNNPDNDPLRKLIINEYNIKPRGPHIDAEILRKAFYWNPNNLVLGPDPYARRDDPKGKIDTILLTPDNMNIVHDQNLNIFEKLTQMDQAPRPGDWIKHGKKWRFQPEQESDGA